MRLGEKWLFFGLPLGALSISLAVIAVRFPLSAPVHEDGERTLTRTILFFEHALGELPLDVLLAAAAAGAALSVLSAPGSPP